MSILKKINSSFLIFQKEELENMKTKEVSLENKNLLVVLAIIQLNEILTHNILDAISKLQDYEEYLQVKKEKIFVKVENLLDLTIKKLYKKERVENKILEKINEIQKLKKRFEIFLGKVKKNISGFIEVKSVEQMMEHLLLVLKENIDSLTSFKKECYIKLEGIDTVEVGLFKEICFSYNKFSIYIGEYITEKYRIPNILERNWLEYTLSLLGIATFSFYATKSIPNFKENILDFYETSKSSYKEIVHKPLVNFISVTKDYYSNQDFLGLFSSIKKVLFFTTENLFIYSIFKPIISTYFYDYRYEGMIGEKIRTLHVLLNDFEKNNENQGKFILEMRNIDFLLKKISFYHHSMLIFDLQELLRPSLNNKQKLAIIERMYKTPQYSIFFKY
jgi:hypothetical protein